MDVVSLRSSFEMVVERQPALTKRFYEILFERYPAVRHLFGHRSQDAQEKMLTSALVAVMDHLEDAVWLTQTLEGLGATHVGYGVTDEMYDWVGDSLLAAIAEAAGNDWSPELEREWAAAFGFIAGTMKAGARRTAAA